MRARGICCIPIALLLAWVLSSCAGTGGKKGREHGEIVILPATEVHDGWYFAAGQEVIIEGTVNGDVYAAAGSVEISGTINGDLIVAGGNINVTGTVSDDIRAAGGTLRFEGKVGKNITAAGGNVSVGRAADVSGGVLAFCGSMLVSGTVKKDMEITGGSTTVSGNIGGNVRVHGEALSVLPGARIEGNLRAMLPDDSQMKIADGSVTGKVELVKSAEVTTTRILGYSSGMFWFKVLWAGWLLLTGAVVFALFRNVFVRSAATLRERTLSTILWGVAGVVLLPVVMVIVAITVLGIPIALLLFDIYFWMAYFSQLSTAVLLGDLIFRNRESKGWAPFWAFAVGLLVVQAMTFIPFVGWLIILAGIVLGFGTVLLLVGDAWKREAVRQPM